MITYIPIAEGQVPAAGVTEALDTQTLYTEVRLVATPGVLNSQRVYTSERLTSEMASRNKCLEYLRDSDIYFCMQDRDIVHLHHDNLKNAVEYLDSNPEVGAVALPFMPEAQRIPAHVRNACFIGRIDAFKDFTFRADEKLCSCMFMKKDLESRGHKYVYYPTEAQLVQEVELENH